MCPSRCSGQSGRSFTSSTSDGSATPEGPTLSLNLPAFLHPVTTTLGEYQRLSPQRLQQSPTWPPHVRCGPSSDTVRPAAFMPRLWPTEPSGKRPLRLFSSLRPSSCPALATWAVVGSLLLCSLLAVLPKPPGQVTAQMSPPQTGLPRPPDCKQCPVPLWHVALL